MRVTKYDFIKWCIISAIIALITACSASKHVTQTVERTSVDTVYINSKQYDSVYIYRDHSEKDTILHSPSKGETEGVLIKDVSVEYRYKLLHDTVKITKRDSIPYEVTITETKEITRPLTWFDRLCRFTFYFLLGVILMWIYNKIGVLKNK